uniref:Ig-like domain-containing protein n=1 Tax=Ruegeria atlantica TaxID=81569 RepID=UPI0020C56C3D
MAKDSAFIANMSELNESGSGQLIRLPAAAFGAVLPVASQSIEAALRDGADLVIVLQSGHQIRIDGFFAEDGRVLVLRDPETGEFFEARLSLDGQMIGVEPRPRDELSELFRATPGEIGALDAAYANDSMAFSDPTVSQGATAVGAATGGAAISTAALIAGVVAIGAVAAAIVSASDDDDDDADPAPAQPGQPDPQVQPDPQPQPDPVVPDPVAPPAPPVVAPDTTAPGAPTVQIATAQDGSVTVSGTAEDGSTVAVTYPDGSQGGATREVTATGGTYSVTIPAGVLSDGAAISVAAIDSAGNSSQATSETYSEPPVAPPAPPVVAPDTTAPGAPTVQIATAQDGSVTVSGTAEDGSTVAVTYPDGSQGGATREVTATGGTYSVTIPAGVLSDGAAISVAAIDSAGNSSQATSETYSEPPVAPPAPPVVAPD